MLHGKVWGGIKTGAEWLTGGGGGQRGPAPPGYRTYSQQPGMGQPGMQQPQFGNMAMPPQARSAFLGGVPGAIGDFGRWIKENPEIAAQILGVGAGAWAESKRGAREDRKFEISEEERLRQIELEKQRFRTQEAAWERIMERRRARGG